mmetsp:Transcript_12911/g.23217  ORF Transcript_12911/g.23217 Transcript_12911/m.23217 type:complete len:374 (+) Transcript_12911:105-1226(+)
MRPTLLSPTTKSPRGVADVLLVENGAEEKLNSSFSWAENSSSSLKESRSPTKKTPTKDNKKVRINSDKPDGKQGKVRRIRKVKPSSSSPASTAAKAKKTKEIQTSVRPSSGQQSPSAELLKAAIIDTKKRIDEVNEQRKKDAQDFKELLRQSKKDCKKELESIYMPMINTHKKDGKSKKQQQAETAKLIEFLKEDNAKIRKEIEHYARKIKELAASNESLERCNHKADKACEELSEEIESMEAIKDKLTDNVSIFKDTLKKMKKDYFKRTRYHQAEAASTGYYDTCIGKILKKVDQCTEPEVIEQVGTIATEGIAEATGERQKHSPDAVLEDLPLSKKNDSGKNKASWSFMYEEETGSNDEFDDSDSDSEDED